MSMQTCPQFVALRLAAVLVMLFCATAVAREVPTDVESFERAASARIQRELPAYDFKSVGRLTLEGKRADGESTGQISLDRVHAFCVREARNCGAALDQFAKGVAETVKERDRPIDRSMVRLAVRPSEYVENVKKRMGSSPAVIYGRPLVAGLTIVPVLDFSRTLRFVGEKDLAKLKVDEDEIFKLGEQNLRATMKPLADVAPVPPANTLGTITGEDYASSRIALHDDWKELAGKLSGNLIVMAPTPDAVIYGDGSTQRGVDALRTFGLELAKKSTRPLSPKILRWTPSGWDEVQ